MASSAYTRSVHSGGKTMSSQGAVLVVAAAVGLVLAMMCGIVEGVDCPTEFIADPVYPYAALCTAPALYGRSTYQLITTASSLDAKFLAPEEGDETSPTNYVRLVDDKSSAGSYEFSSSELRSFVAQKDNVTIKNAKTGRVLAWRREGVEVFLVEAPEAAIGQESVSQPFFQFSQDKDAQLPCPRVLFVRCEAYKILVYGSAPAVGLTAYVKANVTYLTLGAENLVTFFVGVAPSSAESSSMV